MVEFEKFYGKVWIMNEAKLMTIPKQLVDGLGLKKGDILKVMIRKEVKQNEETKED